MARLVGFGMFWEVLWGWVGWLPWLVLGSLIGLGWFLGVVLERVIEGTLGWQGWFWDVLGLGLFVCVSFWGDGCFCFLIVIFVFWMFSIFVQEGLRKQPPPSSGASGEPMEAAEDDPKKKTQESGRREGPGMATDCLV